MAAKFKKGIDLNGQRAVSAGDASSATDLTTLQQVQALVAGLGGLHAPVVAAATGNITLSGTQTIDGVGVTAGQRVLAPAQTTGATNGIYVVAAGAWSRASDADTSAEFANGFATTVLSGTTKGTGTAVTNPLTWTMTNTTAPTLGTTALVFAPAATGGGTYTADGQGIELSGSQFALELDTASGLSKSATGLKVDTAVVVRKYAADCLVTTNPQTFTHLLGTNDVTVTVWDVAGAEVVYPDITKGSGTVIIDWGSAPTAGQYRVIVHG